MMNSAARFPVFAHAPAQRAFFSLRLSRSLPGWCATCACAWSLSCRRLFLCPTSPCSCRRWPRAWRSTARTEKGEGVSPSPRLALNVKRASAFCLLFSERRTPGGRSGGRPWLAAERRSQRLMNQPRREAIQTNEQRLARWRRRRRGRVWWGRGWRWRRRRISRWWGRRRRCGRSSPSRRVPLWVSLAVACVAVVVGRIVGVGVRVHAPATCKSGGGGRKRERGGGTNALSERRQGKPFRARGQQVPTLLPAAAVLAGVPLLLSLVIGMSRGRAASLAAGSAPAAGP